MTPKECTAKLYQLKSLASVNQRYHQIVESRFGRLDRLVRIAIGIIAVLEVLGASKHDSFGDWTIVIAILAFVAALLLNVIPLADREKFHAELFRGWSDVRKGADIQLSRIAAYTHGDHVAEHICERLFELQAKENELHAAEPAPRRRLLARCQGDQIESEWGRGIRTLVAAEQERARRLAPRPPVRPAADSEQAAAPLAGAQ